jgi:hypothetical protein
VLTSASHCHRASQSTEAVDVASSKPRKIHTLATFRRRTHAMLSQVEMRGIETLLILARSLYALKDLRASFSVSFACVNLRLCPNLTYRKYIIHRSSCIALVLMKNPRSRRSSCIPPGVLYPTGHLVSYRAVCTLLGVLYMTGCFVFRHDFIYQEQTRVKAWQKRTRVLRTIINR